ncbi:hypothetical protein HDU76_010647, partial [Blyttiomyces sp. JEL0837]
MSSSTATRSAEPSSRCDESKSIPSRQQPSTTSTTTTSISSAEPSSCSSSGDHHLSPTTSFTFDSAIFTPTPPATATAHEPSPMLKLPTPYSFSGTYIANPLGNEYYERELINRLRAALPALIEKETTLARAAHEIREKGTSASLSDEELVLLQSLEKEWWTAFGETNLVTDQLHILIKRSIARSRESLEKDVAEALTSLQTMASNFWGWITNNNSDQQQHSTSTSTSAYESLPQQEDTGIEKSKECSQSVGMGMGVWKDGAGSSHTLVANDHNSLVADGVEEKASTSNRDA